MAILLNGRKLAAELRRELKEKIIVLGFVPSLGVVLVGDDPASHLYVKLKQQAAAEVGIRVETSLLPAAATIADVVRQVRTFNEQVDINGILVQLPLPARLDETAVISAIDPTKDADGFHPQNLARLLTGKPAVTPGLAEGIVRLIDLAGQNTAGWGAVVLANSQEFAQPLQKLLAGRGVRSIILREINNEALPAADIIVVALGQPGILASELVKDGAIVIDVGTTKVGNRVVGDAAPELVERNIYLTPVPGGVGPMTVAMLLWNVYRLALEQRQP